ncbi:MAG: toxic anion resistance protein [Sarcina sp.]
MNNNLGNDDLNMNKSIDVEYQNEPMQNDMNELNNMNFQMGNMQHNLDANGMPIENMNGHINLGAQQAQGMNNQGMNGQFNQGMNQQYNQQMNNLYNQQNMGNMNSNSQYNQQNMNNQYNQNNMNMGYNNQGMNNRQYQQNQYNQGMNNQMGGYQQQGQMQYGQQNNMNPNNAYMDNSMGQMNNNMGMNMGMNQQNGAMVSQGQEMGIQDVNADISEYKQRLRGMREVQALTSEVDIQNTNSIINFGQKASDNISKISDELLNSMKAVKSEEASEMLTSLTKIMDKFDVKELENAKSESVLSKLFKGMGNTVAKLFQKYDTMGYEVQKVYVLLKKYESDIKDANAHLKKLYDGNLEYYRILEKYIVAGEMAVEEIDTYLAQIPMDNSMNSEEKQMLIQKLEISKDMLSQRVYDLQVAENVAIQAAPMIQTIQMSNFNLMRKINSSFIVTLPIFKQCLAQAVILKRQEIQAKSIKQLDDKTNELILRNASNTARQSVEIAKMASGSSVAIDTLQKSFETIMKGIEDTKAIQSANRQQRTENSHKLEEIKANMKRNIAES